jgi:hypothetical protein
MTYICLTACNITIPAVDVPFLRHVQEQCIALRRYLRSLTFRHDLHAL